MKFRNLKGDRFVNSEGNTIINNGTNYSCGKSFNNKNCDANNQCNSCQKACETLKIYQ